MHATHRPLFALLLVLALVGPAGAQTPAAPSPWRVDVIVSATGGGELGQRQALAADRAAAALTAAGIYRQAVRVGVHDDRGDPRRAETLAREAIDGGALALVCCTAPAATDRVQALAEEHGVMLLALDAARPSDGNWVLQLAATPRAQMTAVAVHAAEEGKVGVGLMTPAGAFGDEAERALERALADTGRTGVGVSRYDGSATVLTPEALWLATREPGSVIAWGLEQDSQRAVDALRRRGYLGPVYVRPESLPRAVWSRARAHDLHAQPPIPTTSDTWLGARLAVPPVAVGTSLPPDHPNAAAVEAFTSRLGAAGTLGRSGPDLVDMAVVDDALQLTRLAFESVAELALPPQSPLVMWRLAFRDALLSAPPRHLAAGTYAPRGGDTRAARWDGLVIVTVGPSTGR
jgi:hypothetical protein